MIILSYTECTLKADFKKPVEQISLTREVNAGKSHNHGWLKSRNGPLFIGGLSFLQYIIYLIKINFINFKAHVKSPNG